MGEAPEMAMCVFVFCWFHHVGVLCPDAQLLAGLSARDKRVSKRVQREQLDHALHANLAHTPWPPRQAHTPSPPRGRRQRTWTRPQRRQGPKQASVPTSSWVAVAAPRVSNQLTPNWTVLGMWPRVSKEHTPNSHTSPGAQIPVSPKGS